MRHLKYLALTLHYRGVRSIDPSISSLKNLETLIIYGEYSKAVSLPSEIWKMSWLRYLVIDRMMLPAIPPDVSLQKLECLHCFVFTNEVIQMIPNVRRLKLRYEGRKGSDICEWYGLNNLLNLLQLEDLSITCYNLGFSFLSRGFLSWGSGFAFPQNLTKLCLDGCGLPWKVMTLVGSLKCLQTLKLRNNACVGNVWESVEGEFQELKFLLLEQLNLMQWRAESIHFPKLQRLKVNLCIYLEEIPSDIGEIGTLEFIFVDDSKEAGESAKKIEEEQKELGNYGLQVIVRNKPQVVWD